jgi:hypothetical protein
MRCPIGAILEGNDFSRKRFFADKPAKTGSGEPCITSLGDFKVRIHQDFERYGQIVSSRAAGVQAP